MSGLRNVQKAENELTITHAQSGVSCTPKGQRKQPGRSVAGTRRMPQQQLFDGLPKLNPLLLQ